MKNVIKKISAIALAFTLLGTGTTVTKTIAPQFYTSITAHAASCNKCHGGSYYMKAEYTEWGYKDGIYTLNIWGSPLKVGYREHRYSWSRCAICGYETPKTEETRDIITNPVQKLWDKLGL